MLFFPDGPSLIAALEAGRVDAVSMARPSLQQLLDKRANPAIAMVSDYTEPDSFKGYPALVVRKSDANFLAALNDALADYLGTPEHLEGVRAYGVTEADLTDVKAADVCAGQ